MILYQFHNVDLLDIPDKSNESAIDDAMLMGLNSHRTNLH